ncbi:hypothetical protein TWF694_007662 [Orbilia ellipsospora]|uniref:RxLR effector protein n=1 Tax=Orbilia ellipsospora TaxID=2528407 RepID=A0AAV9XID4_9PEZI
MKFSQLFYATFIFIAASSASPLGLSVSDIVARHISESTPHVHQVRAPAGPPQKSAGQATPPGTAQIDEAEMVKHMIMTELERAGLDKPTLTFLQSTKPAVFQKISVLPEAQLEKAVEALLNQRLPPGITA